MTMQSNALVAITRFRRSPSTTGVDGGEDPGWCDRQRGEGDVEVAERVADGVGDGPAQPRIPTLAEPAQPERVRVGGDFLVERVDGRHVVYGRQRVVHQRSGEKLAGAVVLETLEHRVADAEQDAAGEMPIERRR